MKIATDPPVSEKQRKAMWAASTGHSTLGIPRAVGKEFVGADSPMRAAGTCLIAEDGEALFLKRSEDSDNPGTWCFPGGHAKDNEEPEQTARREMGEEIGAYPYGEMELMHHAKDDNGEYITFKQPVKHKFTPKLNGEHTEYKWARLDNPPEPLHPGVKMAFDEMSCDAEFKETEHPRGEGGQFGSGGGSKESSESKTIETVKYSIPKELGGDFPDIENVEKRPNKAVVASKENMDLRLFTLPNGKFQASFSPSWGQKNKEFSMIGSDPRELHKAALKRLESSEKTVTSGKKYEKIPSTWKSEEKKISKRMIDEFGDIEFSSSTQSKSKYITLPSGAKVRMSDHPMSANYEKPDYDFRYGGNVEEFINDVKKEEAKKEIKQASDSCLAFDRSSVRTYDQDGRLHIEITNISKANICSYLGEEIPNSQELGLDQKKVYNLLRDPEELEKAAPSFNRIPLICNVDTPNKPEHVPLAIDDHQPDMVVGATGSDAKFVAPYLQNSLVIWTANGIAAVENKDQQELSCAYRYRADMTPGTYDGEPYDGVMRDILGNHVALVASGRAGPDVIVGDSQIQNNNPNQMRALGLNDVDLKERAGSGVKAGDSQLKEVLHMSTKKPLSRKAVMAKGAVLAFLQSNKLAADAKLNLDAILVGVAADNFGKKKAGIIAAIKPKLAADADIESLVKLLDILDNDKGENVVADELPEELEKDKEAKDANPHEQLLTFLRGKISDEDLKSVEDMLVGEEAKEEEEGMEPAMDTPPEFPGKPKDPAQDTEEENVSKTAMDAAIKLASDKAAKEAEKATMKRLTGIREAEKFIAPFVGELIAQDSAEATYKAALETLGVDVSDVHPSAYRAVLAAQPKPGSKQIARDSAMPKSLLDDFPNATRLK